MNTETVEHWLAVIGVPVEVVSVGTEADDAWCVLRGEPLDGEQEPGWEVFWREQGNRYDWARFTNEQVACFYLFGRLAWTQTASGVLRVEAPATPETGDAPAATEPGTLATHDDGTTPDGTTRDARSTQEREPVA